MTALSESINPFSLSTTHPICSSYSPSHQLSRKDCKQPTMKRTTIQWSQKGYNIIRRIRLGSENAMFVCILIVIIQL